MEDFEICHITSVYALNCSEFISFMLAISEDMMDTRRKRRARGLSVQETRKNKQLRNLSHNCQFLPSYYKSLKKKPFIFQIFNLLWHCQSALYNSLTNGGRNFGATAITERNHSKFALSGRHTKTHASSSLRLSHLLSKVVLRLFCKVTYFQLSSLEIIIIFPRL